jgi:hypothetical protein
MSLLGILGTTMTILSRAGVSNLVVGVCDWLMDTNQRYFGYF